MPTRGVVYVHSTPLAVCPHVEWAIARVLTAPVNLHWTAQPVDPGARRAECSWTGRPGTGAELAAALRQWPMIRFEVTEEPSPGFDGERFMYVPGRGLFRATIGAAGDIQLGEDRLRDHHGRRPGRPRRSRTPSTRRSARRGTPSWSRTGTPATARRSRCSPRWAEPAHEHSP